MRTTPENITFLPENHIFVFGSNILGYHIGGAAKTAVQWGAVHGVGFGRQGRTYAIPTIDTIGKTMAPYKIKVFVTEFIEFAKLFPEFNFLVTEIGCGIARMTPDIIALLFIDAITIPNVCLPERFWNVLKTTA